MAKRFSLIDFKDKQVVVSGFKEPDSLPEIPEVLEEVANTSSYEHIDITISHLVFLDYKDTPIEDATKEEVDILQEQLPDFFDIGVIEVVGEIELKIRGLEEDTEIIEAGDL